jgi:hypothetical protein
VLSLANRAVSRAFRIEARHIVVNRVLSGEKPPAKRGPTMRRYHPNPFNEVPISHKVDIRLNAASMINKLGLEPWEIVEEAIDDWLAKSEPGAIPMPQIAGVQWKKLFLPNGTVLRTIFNGKNYHCRVDDDELLYEGKATSPSRFANMVGGLRRNAWKVIWVLLPETRTW